jgi:hypothetical protein
VDAAKKQGCLAMFVLLININATSNQELGDDLSVTFTS